MSKSTRNSSGIENSSFAVTRRDFVAGSAAALTLASTVRSAPVVKRQSSSLFFNLSHLPNAGATHKLFMAGKTYTMQPVVGGHPRLTQALSSNTFLRAVPSSAVTHVVENITLPTDSVSTGYVLTTTSGAEWEMPSFYLNIPAQGFGAAYGPSPPIFRQGRPCRYRPSV